MKVEAVIFDWAGTTVDYGCFAPVKAFMEVFKQFGMQVTMEETREPMGMLKWDHIKTMLEMPSINQQFQTLHGRNFNHADVDEMHQQFSSRLMGILDQFVDVKPYVLDTVQGLRNLGIKIGSTTGYTDDMMKIVTSIAKQNGYCPDTWVSPTSVYNMGRPYPYMVFENMKQLKIHDVRNVIKVGDTISDIEEGLHAGVITVGILEGSSLMGLTREEYEYLSTEEKQLLLARLTKKYKDAGADHVILHAGELLALIASLNEVNA